MKLRILSQISFKYKKPLRIVKGFIQNFLMLQVFSRNPNKLQEVKTTYTHSSGFKVIYPPFMPSRVIISRIAIQHPVAKNSSVLSSSVSSNITLIFYFFVIHCKPCNGRGLFTLENQYLLPIECTNLPSVNEPNNQFKDEVKHRPEP